MDDSATDPTTTTTNPTTSPSLSLSSPPPDDSKQQQHQQLQPSANNNKDETIHVVKMTTTPSPAASAGNGKEEDKEENGEDPPEKRQRVASLLADDNVGPSSSTATTTTTTVSGDSNTSSSSSSSNGDAKKPEAVEATTETRPSIPTATTTKDDTIAANARSKTQAKKIKNKHLNPLMLQVRRQIQQCCATNDLATALEVYRRALQESIKIEAQTFYSLLNLCDGLDRTKIHIGTPKPTNTHTNTTTNSANSENDDDKDSKPQSSSTTTATSTVTTTTSIIRPVDLQTRKQAAFEIKEQMESQHIPMPETGYTALVKLLSRSGGSNDEDLELAQSLIQEAEAKASVKLKLRLYSPLLVQYCRLGKLLPALQLWERWATSSNNEQQQQLQQEGGRALTLTEYEYAALIQCCALHTGDALVVQKVWTELSEDVVIPSRDTCHAIQQWFQSSYAIESSPTCRTTTNDDDRDKTTAMNDDDKDTATRSSTMTKTDETSTTTDEETATSSLPTSNQPPPNNSNNNNTSLLSQISFLPSSSEQPIGPVTCPPNRQWSICSGCLVDTRTGRLIDGCLQDQILQPVPLSAKAWEEMKQMNETIVKNGKLEQDKSPFLGGSKGRKRKFGDQQQYEKEQQQRRIQAWQQFQIFLQTLKQPPKSGQRSCCSNDDDDNNKNNNQFLDVVIDGANVGYFQQNFTGAPKHVNYEQIDLVVQHFLRQQQTNGHDDNNNNNKILLVMHQRHFAPNLMPRRFRPLVQSWETAGILYKSPAGMNDDWFWMHAALVSGPGTLVVTNDEMRDHHFQMLAPRSFLRWKERHQVHFCFGSGGASGFSGGGDGPNNDNNGNGNNNGSYNGRPVILTYPEIYSRRIQRLADGYAIPHPKRGDENRFLDGTHVADKDVPLEETYLCIRPMPVVQSTSSYTTVV